MLLETTNLKKMNTLHKSHIKNLLKVIGKLAECKDEEVLPAKADIGAQYSATECEIIYQASKSDSKEQSFADSNANNSLVQAQQDCNNQIAPINKRGDTVVGNTNNLAVSSINIGTQFNYRLSL